MCMEPYPLKRYIKQINFTQLKLCFVTASRNIKWVNITHILHALVSLDLS